MMGRPEDECECGDYRSDHEDDGEGRCRLPNDLTHGFKPCLRFKHFERRAVKRCICDDWPGNYEGAREDCPEHGRKEVPS